MPIDYKKYPKNWKSEIRPKILERADNSCELCGVKNYSVGFHDNNGEFIATHEPPYNHDLKRNDCQAAIEIKERVNEGNQFFTVKVIILTIAHLDHDINNNVFSNLKALCQKCHLAHDKEHHLENSRKTRERKRGLLKIDFNEQL